MLALFFLISAAILPQVLEKLRALARTKPVTVVAYHELTLADLAKFAFLEREECWPEFQTCRYRVKAAP